MVIQKRSDLARLIKATATMQGMTLDALAQRLGVSRSSLSRTVNKSDIGASTLQAIADGLGCDLVLDLRPREESGDGFQGV